MIDPIELHELADGELSKERAEAVRRLLAESPEANREYEAILAVKTVLRERVSSVECRQEWKACVGRLNELDRTRKVERLVSGRFAWGLCGVFFVAIIVAGFGHRGVPTSNEQSATLARMAASIGPSRNAPVSPDRQALDSSLDAMLKQARVWIDPNRMELKNWAFGNLDGRPVARVTLRDANGDLALMVVADVIEFDGLGALPQDHSFRLGHVQGMNCVAWTDGTNTLVLVGRRTYEDLASVASRLTLKRG